MRFTVERNKWRCGGDDESVASAHGSGMTKMLNGDGFRCCLGFVGQQLGCPDGHMRQMDMPAQCRFFRDVLGEMQLSTRGREIFRDSELAKQAVEINDEHEITREDREQQLVDLFAHHGHEVVFVGEYET